MKISIKNKSSRTKEEYYNNQVQWLTVKPFQSNILGLTLCLQNANGLGRKIPISDTTILTRENISAYGYFWFEYSSTDKDYDVTVTLD